MSAALALPKMYELYSPATKRIADHAKKAAEDLGGGWVHFCQDIYLNGQVLGSAGVCYALSMVFLSRVKTGAGAFTSYIFSNAGRTQVMDLWTMQKTEVAGWEKLYLAEAGLRQRYCRRNDTLEQIKLLLAIPGYYSVGLTNQYADDTTPLPEIGSGHAFGVVNAGDKHYLFDPNLGTGAFPGADGPGRMLGMLAKYVYKQFTKGETLLTRYS